MTKKRIFIDGQQGTTGLSIAQRLKARDDLELVPIPDEYRKDAALKAEIANSVDLVILCLPDQGAIAAVEGITNPQVKILDSSTVHRVQSHWAYGMPELAPAYREAIRSSRLVANPGCYPTGFLLALVPLLQAGLLDPKHNFSMHAVSGYSGGGRQMIEKYSHPETPGLAAEHLSTEQRAYGVYGLTQNHKHIAEMRIHAKLAHFPHFSPSVGNFRQGMITQIPLFEQMFIKPTDRAAVHACLAEYFADEPCVQLAALDDDSAFQQGFLQAACADYDALRLFVCGNDSRMSLIAAYDNLGKGASGAAVQNLNLMLGCDEHRSLHLKRPLSTTGA